MVVDLAHCQLTHCIYFLRLCPHSCQSKQIYCPEWGGWLTIFIVASANISLDFVCVVDLHQSKQGLDVSDAFCLVGWVACDAQFDQFLKEPLNWLVAILAGKREHSRVTWWDQTMSNIVSHEVQETWREIQKQYYHSRVLRVAHKSHYQIVWHYCCVHSASNRIQLIQKWHLVLFRVGIESTVLGLQSTDIRIHYLEYMGLY